MSSSETESEEHSSQLSEDMLFSISFNLYQKQYETTSQTIVNPIRDVKIRWNSTFFVLKRLLHLQYAVKQLARSLCHHPESQQRKDGQNLSKKLLLEAECEELNELALLLEPFIQTTKLIGEKNIQNTISEIMELTANTINIPVHTEMDQLYNDYIQNDYLENNELE
ncbi:7046_t:CDS:2 [Gigaspora margarita]|uniref:7046_t:CDS:1 n=1 Tax=Gigaspora margarita TaxID=4874 RepID=A0ABM8VYS0_GIGMA|nr:7046_t:CDS:2 [Gigaspora margarita]